MKRVPHRPAAVARSPRSHKGSASKTKQKKMIITVEKATRDDLLTDECTKFNQICENFRAEIDTVKDAVIARLTRSLAEAELRSERRIVGKNEALRTLVEIVFRLHKKLQRVGAVDSTAAHPPSISRSASITDAIVKSAEVALSKIDEQTNMLVEQAGSAAHSMHCLQTQLDTATQQRDSAEVALRAALMHGTTDATDGEAVRQLERDVHNWMNATHSQMIAAIDELLHDSAGICYETKKFHVVADQADVKERFMSRARKTMVEQEKIMHDIKLFLVEQQRRSFRTDAVEGVRLEYNGCVLPNDYRKTLQGFQRDDILELLLFAAYHPPVAETIIAILDVYSGLVANDAGSVPKLTDAISEVVGRARTQARDVHPATKFIPTSAMLPNGVAETMMESAALRMTPLGAAVRHREYPHHTGDLLGTNHPPTCPTADLFSQMQRKLLKELE